MKQSMGIVILAAGAFFSFRSSSVWAAFEKPVCHDMTREIWDRNQQACAKKFESSVRAGRIEADRAAKICECVADELINKRSCADLQRFDADKKFVSEQTEKITKICHDKEGAQAKPR